MKLLATAVPLVDDLCAALSGITGIETASSRFGSGANRAWRIAGREIAHLHSSSRVDHRLPPALQARLRSDPHAHPRADRSEWMELEFHTHADVAKIAVLAGEAAAAQCARSEREKRR